MSAKDDFLLRIFSVKAALSESVLADGLLTAHDHNRKAAILRNGLAVVGFAALEDFFKKRMSEVLFEVGRTGCSFSRLPERLRSAVTHDMVAALKQQLYYRDSVSDKILFMQEESRKIASTATLPYDLSPIAFGYASSNVGADDVRDALQAFNVSAPWESIDRLSSSLGLAAMSLKNSYRVAYSRRNRAAHVASANTPLPELEQFVKDAVSIAVAFDFLISLALLKIRLLDSAYLGGRLIGAGDLMIWVLKKDGGTWRFKRIGPGRAKRASKDFVSLRNLARADVVAAREALVIFDEHGAVLDWVQPQ